jgi:hypothetical protein
MKIEEGKTYKFKIIDKNSIPPHLVFSEHAILPCWSDKEKMVFLHLFHKDDSDIIKLWNNGFVRFITAKVGRICLPCLSNNGSIMYYDIKVYDKCIDVS